MQSLRGQVIALGRLGMILVLVAAVFVGGLGLGLGVSSTRAQGR